MPNPDAGGAHDPLLRSEDQARAALIDACLQLSARGVNQGKAGNASVRWDRGARPGMLITPSALPYEQMRIDDIVWLTLECAPGGAGDEARPALIDSAGRRPSSEWRLHRDVYLGRPEAAAVVHAHPPHATALACLPGVQSGGMPAFHYMVAMAGGRDIRCATYATFGTQALSEATLAALEGRRACLMAHHGIVALGSSLSAALGLAEEVETLSRMYLLALTAGKPALLPDAEMDRVLARFQDYRPELQAQARGSFAPDAARPAT